MSNEGAARLTEREGPLMSGASREVENPESTGPPETIITLHQTRKRSVRNYKPMKKGYVLCT